MVATAFFLPFGFGNPYVVRLLRNLRPAAPGSAEPLIVQVTLTPRIRTGLRALLEDADDVGWLTIKAKELAFTGDSVKFSLPFAQIKQVKLRNIGLRGLFIYHAISLRVHGLSGVDSIQIAERSSSLLPASKRITNQLYKQLSSP
jgi:hypothetical protein